MNGDAFMNVPLTSVDELSPFVKSLAKVPKTGLHNPFKNPERYLELAHVSNKAGQCLRDPDIADFFTRLIQRVCPKSYAQARGEVDVTAQFLENFSGDQVRFMAQSFGVSGDHMGQESRGYRWPYGPVAIITPFNFGLEIPVLQLMGALFMGNKPVLKSDNKVSVIMEQFLLMLINSCGLNPADVDFLNSDGPTMQRLLRAAKPRNTLFTGSSRVGEILTRETKGKIKLEDAGFDWKVLGPDVPRDSNLVDYVAWQADQDAYGFSGQKCSAQSIMFMNRAWKKVDFLEKVGDLARRRNLEDLTIGPVLSWTTEAMLAHVQELLKLKGAELLWGGKELQGHSIPSCYGAIEPTAVYVPLSTMRNQKAFKLATKEVFGPVQVITDYNKQGINRVKSYLERMDHHLTAAIVSNDIGFQQDMLGSTVNGTTYVGMRARTTGAPQNHWFGPAGDPRGAGIGSPEAIKLVWSCHREIIHDVGPIAEGWTTPKAT